jgi:two-component system OmpR family sensor kinase
VSLRARVLLGLAAIACVLVAAGLLVTRTTEAYLLDQVDEQLGRLGAPAPGGGPGGLVINRQLPSGEVEGGQPERLSQIYVGFITEAGDLQTVFEPNLAGTGAAAVPDVSPDEAIAAAETGEPFTVGAVGSDGRFRVRAVTDPASGLVQVVAAPLDDADAAISRLVTVEVVATAVALAALGVVAWWVIRLGVRPVKEMADAAAAIAGGDLSHRVPEGDPRTEAGELGAALNGMLGRIEDAFDERSRADRRLRQFVADASHELRTPVTTIRGYAELYGTGGLDEPAALDDAMRRTGQEAVRMGALVEDMLHLARLDQGRPLAREPVDLGDLARDAAADARAVDGERPVTVTVAAPANVTGDPDRLRQVLANLVGNARVHTPPGTRVAIDVARRGDEAVVEVADTGPGMAPAVAERAFERFYRADPSRSRHRGGSGLGLAIVHAIVTAHGGRVDLDSTPGEGTRVRVVLPSPR